MIIVTIRELLEYGKAQLAENPLLPDPNDRLRLVNYLIRMRLFEIHTLRCELEELEKIRDSIKKEITTGCR